MDKVYYNLSMYIDVNVLRALGINATMLKRRILDVEKRLGLIGTLSGSNFSWQSTDYILRNCAGGNMNLRWLAKVPQASLYNLAHARGIFDKITSQDLVRRKSNPVYKPVLTKDMAILNEDDGKLLRDCFLRREFALEHVVAAIAVYEETRRFRTLLPVSNKPGPEEPGSGQTNVLYLPRPAPAGGKRRP